MVIKERFISTELKKTQHFNLRFHIGSVLLLLAEDLS